MKLLETIHIFQRKLLHLRLRPIRVFCFHQVSDEFDESTMKRGDWLHIDMFKREVNKLRNEGYMFISLPEAYDKLKYDKFRFHKYAVMTADDGWASLRNILPWLNEQQIPVTLFLNPAYLDGKHYRERDTEKYLTESEVLRLHEQYPFLTIGSHGWEHDDATKQTAEEFDKSVMDSMNALSILPNFIPFFAYTWGKHTKATDAYLLSQAIIPIYIDGQKNYDNRNVIHRESLK